MALLFASLLVIVIRPEIPGQMVQYLLQAINFFPFPHLLHQNSSPTNGAPSVGVGHSFLLSPYNLTL